MLKGGELGDCSQVLESYNRRCHELFPLAVAFKPLEESAAHSPGNTDGKKQSETSSVSPSGGKDELAGGQG